MGFKLKKGPFLAILETSTLLTSTKPSSQPLSLFCPERERERERERENHRSEKETYTHTHTPRERDMGFFLFSFFFFWVLGLEEKGHGWFGRERFWVWKKNHLQYRKKKEEGKKEKKKEKKKS